MYKVKVEWRRICGQLDFLEKDVLCVLRQSNCLDTTVDVCGMLSVVRAACVNDEHCMASPRQCLGLHIVRGTHGGGLGVVSFPRCVLGAPPCIGEGF